tara:strand:- start:800 stop:1549 length:750 start_codon:yes stop_codon:yes gene_type:complete
MKKSILIFIISHYASFRLLNLYKKIPLDQLKNYDVKILISDDSSKDDTWEIAKKIKEENENIVLNYNKLNLGYGGNIKFCLDYANKNNFDYVAMLHGDGQYHPKYIVEMVYKLENNENYNAIVGSRMINKKDAISGKMPIYKFLGNIILTKLSNLILRQKTTDCHSGFWTYRVKSIKKLKYFNNSNGFNFDQQIRMQFADQKMEIAEVPIITFYGTEKSYFHFVYSSRFILELFFYLLIKLRLYKSSRF